MTMLPALVLRDVQLPAAPGWWPLPLGWWLVIALLSAVLLVAIVLSLRRLRARRRWARVFDQRLAQALSPGEQVLAAAEMLRRGALQHAPQAAALQGQAWLAWVYGRDAGTADVAGQVLLDGGYRARLPADQAQAACALARKRFITLMTVHR